MSTVDETLSIKKAEEAAQNLFGSSQALYENYEEWQDDTIFCERLDELVFCCDNCGWWFEQPAVDNGSGWVCEDCDSEH